MANSEETRSERTAALLEAQLKNCGALLDDWLTERDKDGDLRFNALANASGLLKITAQIASTIARLEGLKTRNVENRGSIPQ